MRRFLFLLLLASVPTGVLGAPGKEPGPMAEAGGSQASAAATELKSLARDLASPQFRIRQRAYEQLLKAQAASLPALSDAVRSDDREARSRALAILVSLSASRNEGIAHAARETLDTLASDTNAKYGRQLQEALADARWARFSRAVKAIELGGGTITSGEGGASTDERPLSIRIGSTWKQGNDGLRILADLPAISWLSLEGAPIDDAALVHVAALPNLEKLYLKGTLVRGPGLARLAQLSRLTHLSLRDLPLDDAALAQLPDLPQLSHLGLDRTRISDAGLAELKRFPRLDTLWLDDTRVTDAGLAELQALRSLQTLFLTGTKTGGPGLASLKQVPSLRFLSLTGVQLSPDASSFLAELSQIEILGLDHTNVRDEQLQGLAKLKRLKTLWLTQTPITDAGIEHLQQIKSLEMVYLSGSQVTAEGRRQLREALPDCTVEPHDNERRRRRGR